MKRVYTHSKSILLALLVLIILLVISCNHDNKPAKLPKTTNRFRPPKVTVLADLPDSLQPKVNRLADRPKPKIVINSKPGKIHSFIDKRTQQPLAPEVQGKGFFTTYTSDNGLASDEVMSGLMDRTGVLWFGCNNGGLSRYDGKTFETYTVDHGLAGYTPRSILEDRAGNLWMGMDGDGVSKYDGKTFTTYSTNQGLASDDVIGIAEDKAGNIWFATLGAGVSKFDGKRFTTYTTVHGLANNAVWNILSDTAGNLWFTTDGGGVSKYDGKRFTTYTMDHGLAGNDVFSVLQDKTGNLWFGCLGAGISKYDGNTFTTYSTTHGLVSNLIVSSLEDKAGNLWFGSMNGGVSKYDGNTFTNFTTAQGLANNGVSSIIEDKQGTIWFCTLGGGVSKYGEGFTRFTTEQGLTNNVVGEISRDKAQNLWLCTFMGGVTKYDGKQFANYMSAQGLAQSNVLANIVDRSGNLWFGTDGGGVSKFDGKSFTNYTTAQGLVNNYVSSILEDRAGTIWLGASNGISRFDGPRIITYPQSIMSRFINCILEDRRGHLWFGTDGGGVSRFDGKRFIIYTMAQGLASNSVTRIAEDKTGNLLFCTDNGLSVITAKRLNKGIDNLNEPLFKTYTTKDGLPDNSVTHILEDQEGKLIIGSKGGLSVLKEGLRSFSKPKSGTIDIYTSTTGYPVKSANYLCADSKGILWISTNSDKTGLVRFDEKAVHKSRNAPALVLKTIKINNQTVIWNDLLSSPKETNTRDSISSPAHIIEEVSALDRALTDSERDSLRRQFVDVRFDSVASWYPIPQNLVLPYRHNNISFEFNAIETSRNFLVKYQYKLEGYDEDWSPLSTKSSATFGNMNAGRYTFWVKALSPEGVWSKPIAYSFTVLPPWWQTWWAYILYALAVGGVVWVIVRLRSRQLQKENQLLEEKVNLRTRQLEQKSTELEESLATLKTTQNQLIQKEKMASLGELTAGIAHEIQNPLNLVNNFTQLSQRQLGELQAEQQSPNPDAELQTELITDLKDNLDKILHHGQRASSIVKGMLAHSRTATGEVQSTDLNVLAEEYLRLAYQGQRNKEKAFNCTLVTELDPAVGTVPVMRQELGRVLVNLFTNAFYAVNQRQQGTGAGYEPEVRLITKRGESGVELRVIDNGVGMSGVVLGKLFQPFFTTKPAGQGTGLGLSLSYDIVTRGHGGSLTVESKEGECSAFTVKLPL